jgi:hypothetical protein
MSITMKSLCVRFTLATLVCCIYCLSAQAQTRREFDIRVSALAGWDIVRTINGQAAMNFGLRAGVQLPSGVYAGLIAAIHPLAIQGQPDTQYNVTPLILGGEAGYEFVLTPTMFLRPYIGLCRFGVDGSYRGNNLTILPEMETTEFMFGVTYSIEVARDLLVGAELRGVNRGGLHLCLHAGFRL